MTGNNSCATAVAAAVLHGEKTSKNEKTNQRMRKQNQRIRKLNQRMKNKINEINRRTLYHTPHIHMIAL